MPTKRMTVIFTATQPITVKETVEEVKALLKTAKEDRSKFIYPHTEIGDPCIICVDIIAAVMISNVVMEELVKSNIIKPPDFH